jgi:LmbE family N-acetylglucosaminyl deacetylase
MSVLLEPHHDDGCLFAAYTILRERPDVITVMGQAKVQERYGISELERAEESTQAMRVLQANSWRSWRHSDVNPSQEAIVDDMLRLNTVLHPKVVWAPLWEKDGHEQHNLVSILAERVFGRRCGFYATYKRGSGRTRTVDEVTPEPDWPALKFQAMACYASQINLENTRPWFSDWDREWVA